MVHELEGPVRSSVIAMEAFSGHAAYHHWKCPSQHSLQAGDKRGIKPWTCVPELSLNQLASGCIKTAEIRDRGSVLTAQLGIGACLWRASQSNGYEQRRKQEGSHAEENNFEDLLDTG